MTNKIYIVAGERNMELAALGGRGLYVNVGQTTRDVEDRLRDDDYKRKAAGGKWKVILQQDVGELTDKDIHPILKKHPRISWDPDSNNTEEFLFVDDPGDGSVARKTVIEILTPYCQSLLKKENENLRDRISALEEEVGAFASLFGSQGIDLQKIQEIEQENECLKDSLNASKQENERWASAHRSALGLLAVNEQDNERLKDALNTSNRLLAVNEQDNERLEQENERLEQENERWAFALNTSKQENERLEQENERLKDAMERRSECFEQSEKKFEETNKELQEYRVMCDRLQSGAEQVLKKYRDKSKLTQDLENERDILKGTLQSYRKHFQDLTDGAMVTLAAAIVVAGLASGFIFWIHRQVPHDSSVVAAVENSSSQTAPAEILPAAAIEQATSVTIDPPRAAAEAAAPTPTTAPAQRSTHPYIERIRAERAARLAAEKAVEDAEYAPVDLPPEPPAAKAPPPPLTKPAHQDPLYTKDDLFLKFKNCIHSQTAISWNDIIDIMKCNSGNDLKMKACLMVPHGRNWVSGIADLSHASDCWEKNH